MNMNLHYMYVLCVLFLVVASCSGFSHHVRYTISSSSTLIRNTIMAPSLLPTTLLPHLTPHLHITSTLHHTQHMSTQRTSTQRMSTQRMSTQRNSIHLVHILIHCTSTSPLNWDTLRKYFMYSLSSYCPAEGVCIISLFMQISLVFLFLFHFFLYIFLQLIYDYLRDCLIGPVAGVPLFRFLL